MSNGRNSSTSITAKQDAALSASVQSKQCGKSDVRGERLSNSRASKKKSVKKTSSNLVTASSEALSSADLSTLSNASSTSLIDASSLSNSVALGDASSLGALVVPDAKSKHKKSRSALKNREVSQVKDGLQVKSHALSKTKARATFKPANKVSSTIASQSKPKVFTGSKVFSRPVSESTSNPPSKAMSTIASSPSPQAQAVNEVANSLSAASCDLINTVSASAIGTAALSSNVTRNTRSAVALSSDVAKNTSSAVVVSSKSHVVVKQNQGQGDLFSDITDSATKSTAPSSGYGSSALESPMTSDYGVEVTDAGRGVEDSFSSHKPAVLLGQGTIVKQEAISTSSVLGSAVTNIASSKQDPSHVKFKLHLQPKTDPKHIQSSFRSGNPNILNFSFDNSQHTEQVGMSSNDFDSNDLPKKQGDDLDIDQLRSDVYGVFAQGGIFSSKLKNYSPRPGQIELADTVAQGLGADTGILMVEAGTGTGKTFSYLVPPILAHKRVIVSTGTKALQDQLVDKDIPNLLKILDQHRLMFMGLKGHANYICRYMFDELNSSTFGRDDLEKVSNYLDETIEQIEDIYAGKIYGTAPNFAEMRLRLRDDQRKLLSCDSLSCRKKRKHCDFANVSNKDNMADIQDSCFITAARAFAQKCGIVTINHALFFASLGISRPCFQEQNGATVNPNGSTINPNGSSVNPNETAINLGRVDDNEISVPIADSNSVVHEAAGNGGNLLDSNGLEVAGNLDKAGSENGSDKLSAQAGTESVNKSSIGSHNSVTVALVKDDEATLAIDATEDGATDSQSIDNHPVDGMLDLNFTNMIDLSDSLKDENMTDRVMNMLPKPDVLVFDEAHTLPEVGRSFFTRRFSRDEIKEFCQDLKSELKEISGYAETPEILNALGDIDSALSDLDYTLCSLEPRRYSILEFKYIHADGVNYVKVQKGLLSEDAGGLVSDNSLVESSPSGTVQVSDLHNSQPSTSLSQVASLRGKTSTSQDDVTSQDAVLDGKSSTSYAHNTTTGNGYGKTKGRTKSSIHQYKSARASKYEIIVSQKLSGLDIAISKLSGLNLAIPMRLVESLSTNSFITVQGVKESQTEHCDYTPSWDQSNFNDGFSNNNGSYSQRRQNRQYQPFKQNQAFNQNQPFVQRQAFNQGQAFNPLQSHVQPNTQSQQTDKQNYQSVNQNYQSANHNYHAAHPNYNSVNQNHQAVNRVGNQALRSAPQTLNQSQNFYQNQSSYRNSDSSFVQPQPPFNLGAGKSFNGQYAAGNSAQVSNSNLAGYNHHNSAWDVQGTYSSQSKTQEQQGVSDPSYTNGHTTQGLHPWSQRGNEVSNQASLIQSGQNTTAPYVTSNGYAQPIQELQGRGGVGVYNSAHTLASSPSNQVVQGLTQESSNQHQVIHNQQHFANNQGGATYGNGVFTNNHSQLTNGQGQYSARQQSNLPSNSRSINLSSANANQQANTYYAQNNHNSRNAWYQQSQGHDNQTQTVALNPTQNFGANSNQGFNQSLNASVGQVLSQQGRPEFVQYAQPVQNDADLKPHQVGNNQTSFNAYQGSEQSINGGKSSGYQSSLFDRINYPSQAQSTVYPQVSQPQASQDPYQNRGVANPHELYGTNTQNVQGSQYGNSTSHNFAPASNQTAASGGLGMQGSKSQFSQNNQDRRLQSNSQPDHLSQKLDEIEFIAQHSRNGKYVNYGLLKAQHQEELNRERDEQEQSQVPDPSGYKGPANRKSYSGSSRTNSSDTIAANTMAAESISDISYRYKAGKGESYISASGQQEQTSPSNGGYWSGEDSFVKSQQQGVKASNATALRRNSRAYGSNRPYVNKDYVAGTEYSSQGAGAVKPSYANANRGYGNKTYGKSTQGYAFNANSQRRDEDKVVYQMENGREVINLEFRGIIVRLVKALVKVQTFVKSLKNAESEESVGNALEFIEDMLAFMTDLMTTDRDKFGQPKYEFVAWVKVTDPHHDHEQIMDEGREDESAEGGLRHESYAQRGAGVNALGGSAGVYGSSADASHKITIAADKNSAVVRDNNYEIVLAPIEIGKFLGPELRKLTAAGISIVFASATITTSQDFSKFCYDLGLSQDEVQTKIVESPFDYAKNARIMYSQSFVDVNDPQRMSKHVELLKPVIDASPGGVFFLTTSYTSLKEAEQECVKHFSGKRRIYVQGSDSINNLMDAFRKDGHGILIGTSSFWEGVDVPGQALSLVIIDKLPFKTANDPVNRARMDYCDLTKGNSFYNIAVPEAIIKLRQGVGRLIRNEKDLGALIILDPRLESKKYGQTFVASLPPMTRVKSFQEILDFFKYIKSRPHQA